MRITINGKGVEVSEYLAEVVEKRVSKLDKYFHRDTEADVMVSMLRGRQVVEITVRCPGMILRAEEASGDMYASIDAACKKLEKQILRHKTKLSKRLRETAFEKMEPVYLEPDEEPEAEEVEGGLRIVRNKRFTLKPMTEEEAALQLEMLGHSFYVFANGESGKVNVLYKRRDGDYGLIEPELE